MVVVKVRLLAVRPRRSSRKRSPSVRAVDSQGKRAELGEQLAPVSSAAMMPSPMDATSIRRRRARHRPARDPCAGGRQRCSGLIVLGLAWELWLAPAAPGRHLAGAQGAAPVHPAGRPAAAPHVHLPLGQPAGVALFHRRRGARRGATRPRRAAGGAARSCCASLLFTACALHVRTAPGPKEHHERI